MHAMYQNNKMTKSQDKIKNRKNTMTNVAGPYNYIPDESASRSISFPRAKKSSKLILPEISKGTKTPNKCMHNLYSLFILHSNSPYLVFKTLVKGINSKPRKVKHLVKNLKRAPREAEHFYKLNLSDLKVSDFRSVSVVY